MSSSKGMFKGGHKNNRESVSSEEEGECKRVSGMKKIIDDDLNNRKLFRVRKKYKKEIIKSIASEKTLHFTSPKDFNAYINRFYSNRLINGIPRITRLNDISNFYTQYQQYLRFYFSKLDRRVSLALDICRDVRNLDYLIVTCHWINSDWLMENRIIACRFIEDKNNSNFIVASIRDILTFFGLNNKIMCISSNNNFFNDISALEIQSIPPLNGNFHVNYYKIRGAILFIFQNNSKTKIKEFRKNCNDFNLKPKKISTDTSKNWNSLYIMLNVAYKYREPISVTYNNYIEKNSADFLIDSDWDIIEIIVKILSRFHKTIKEFFSNSDPNICNILSHITNFAYLLSKYKDNEIYIPIKEKFKKYFIPMPPIFQISAVLNLDLKLIYAKEFTRGLYELLSIGEEVKPNLEDAKSSLFSNTEALFNYYKQLKKDNDKKLNISKPKDIDSLDYCVDKLIGLKKASEFDSYVSQHGESTNISILQSGRIDQTFNRVMIKMVRDVFSVPVVSTVTSERMRIRSLSRSTAKMLVCVEDWIKTKRRKQYAEEKTQLEDGDEELEDDVIMLDDDESDNQDYQTPINPSYIDIKELINIF